MIIISGTVKIKPEHTAEAIEKAVCMQSLTQGEPGCKVYRFYADLERPNVFGVFEEWESEEALKAHFQTADMAEFNQVLGRVLAKPDLMGYQGSERAAF